jgi:hypothetical protein
MAGSAAGYRNGRARMKLWHGPFGYTPAAPLGRFRNPVAGGIGIRPPATHEQPRPLQPPAAR